MKNKTLSSQYQDQYKWRDWKVAFDLCTITGHLSILDLGCGVGDLSAELSKLGCLVTGVDGNAELLNTARNGNIKNCSFINQDLRDLDFPSNQFDGIWCSYTSAYFTDFDKQLKVG